MLKPRKTLFLVFFRKKDILFTNHKLLHVDDDKCFCPFDLNLMNYVHFVYKCKALLLSIDSCDEMKFHLFMYQPIVFYLYFLDCVNDWLVEDFNELSEASDGDISVFNGLVRLSEIRKRFLKFGINHELCDGYHRTQALNIMMKECSLQQEGNKSLQKKLDVSSLKNVSFDDHYIFLRLLDVNVMSRSDDSSCGFRDEVCTNVQERLDDFCTLKKLSENKNENSAKTQPTSFQSATEELLNFAYEKCSSGKVQVYSLTKDESLSSQMITLNYGKEEYDTLTQHYQNKFKFDSDPEKHDNFKLSSLGFLNYFRNII